MRWTRLSAAITVLCGCLTSLDAAVSLASLFTDHAVLQRDKPIAVWGKADPGEAVNVTFDGSKQTTMAAADGTWRVSLPAHKAGGPYELTVAGTNTITLKDILVGEVWICSGQSNMSFAVRGAINAETEIKSANFPKLRHFAVTRATAPTPQDTCEGTWNVCAPEVAGSFTAVGYFFGRKLVQELDIPIGLVHTSWGGTPAEAWTSLTALESQAQFKSVIEESNKRIANSAAEKEKYNAALAKWEKAAAAAKAAGKPEPKKPRFNDPEKPQRRPATLYNGMIQPLVPYTIRGAIWYQGEANASRHASYQALLSLMIGDWRQAFGQGDFPFYIVQLANFKKRVDQPTDPDWARLRDAQYLTATTVPNTGLAVAIDVGDADDIHPKNKQDVGFRLALNALAKDYGKQIEYSGPVYKAMTVSGNKAVLTFDHLGGGLATSDGQALVGFALAGNDGNFVWAKADIVGDTIEVSADGVSDPKAVRYAWADNPACNLINKAGLPAVPFATDR